MTLNQQFGGISECGESESGSVLSKCKESESALSKCEELESDYQNMRSRSRLLGDPTPQPV